jgi:hypothetical protein
MSTSANDSTGSAPPAVPPRRSAPPWLREPLLHFVLLGGGLFAVDHFLISATDDPRTIVIDAAVDEEARQTFEDARGREPDEDELYALRRVWLDNEVLYREGLALELDRGDPAIRDRVIFKALSMIDAGTKLPPIDDQGLRAWFEQNRAKYDEPARYDFEEAVLSDTPSEDGLRAFVGALNAGAPTEADRAGLRVFTDRPRDNLVQSYGGDFVAALEASPPGEWRALPSLEGLRAIRLVAFSPPLPGVYEDLRGVVLQDWTDTTLAEQRSAAVGALAKKYVVKTEHMAQTATLAAAEDEHEGEIE